MTTRSIMSRPPDPHARVDLLRAARAVFVESGLDRARVEQITDRAGRSKGSFYLHFASKEDAFREVVAALIGSLAEMLEEVDAPATAAADPVAFLEHWRRSDLRLFEFLWENRGVARLVFHGGGSAAFGHLIDEFAERARARIQEAMHAMVRAGFYRAGLDVEVNSMLLAGAYDRVARALVQQRRKPDLRRWLGQLQETLLRGIAAPRLLAVLETDWRAKETPTSAEEKDGEGSALPTTHASRPRSRSSRAS